MELFGIEVEVKNKPALDNGFMPVTIWNKAYLSKAREPFVLSITGNDNRCVVYRTRIRNHADSKAADQYYVGKLVKTLLWIYGGYKITVTGSVSMYEFIKQEFSEAGGRAFDAGFMSSIYHQYVEVESSPSPLTENLSPKFLSRHLNGYRIGFEAGTTARKVAAVANGKVLYTEEVLWHPTTESDPSYHYQGMLDGILAAAKKLPRIDAIGISSSGIFLHNETKVGAIFHGVSPEDFHYQVRDIYPRVAQAMGCKNIEVINEGDVATLSGAMSLDANNILGITMGDTLSSGFIDSKGNLTGWLNELAFVPIDLNPMAPFDSWSGERGCGESYFSQSAVFRLAEIAGVRVDPTENPSQQLKSIQIRMERGEKRATSIFSTIGTYLGHSLAYYHSFYNFQFVLLLGGVMSGAGGDLIFNTAQKILAEEYTSIASSIVISIPDQNSTTTNQAIAAASLPEC